MGRIGLRISFAAILLGLSVSAGWTQGKPEQKQQEQTSQKPKDTRVASPLAPLAPLAAGTTKNRKSATELSTGGSESSSSGQAFRPLSGVEQYTLSTMGKGHSYFIPVFQVAEAADTNAREQFGSSTFQAASMISGAFSLNHVWSRYNFAANYAGTGVLYNRDLSLSSSAHSFTLTQTVQGARSSLLLADAVSYLPEASFGFVRFPQMGGLGGGFGGLSGVNTSGLSDMYIPNQSILTGDSSRVSNAAMGQYNYNLSPLSSVTVNGAYALLRFPSSGLIGSNAGIFGLGYNHAIGRKDTVAVNYTGSVYRFTNQADYNFTNHVVELIYGHQISRLFSLQLGGGPQINIFSNGSQGDTMVSWHATTSLHYHLPRTGFSLQYMHYTTAGSGVYLGAETDNLSLGIGRQITRMWSGDIGLGYSHNKSLQATTQAATFDGWYGSTDLTRQLGPYMSLYLSYNLQQQVSSAPFCTVNSCGSFYTSNYFSIGFSWHPRPVDVTEEE